MRSNPCPGARFGRPVFFSRAGDNPDMDHLRREYDWGELSEDELHEDPLEQFRRWFDDALDAEEPLPDAMTLATADADGAPNARIVVLRPLAEPRTGEYKAMITFDRANAGRIENGAVSFGVSLGVPIYATYGDVERVATLPGVSPSGGGLVFDVSSTGTAHARLSG